MTDAWEKAAVLSQALAAAGTFAAVFVSLYLARKNSRPTLRVEASHVALIEQGVGVQDRYFRVSVANAGAIPVTVVSYGYTVGRIRKAYFIQTLAAGVAAIYSASLPARIEPGSSATFLHPRGELESTAAPLFDAVAKRVRWWSRRPPVWLVVHTAAGLSARQRLSPNIVDWMISHAPSRALSANATIASAKAPS